MSFDALGLTPELLRAVADQGYTEPTPVQSEAIPLVLAGRDLLAGAQTGTGKTAAFVLPILQRLNATRTPGWNGGPPSPASASRDRRAEPRPPVRALILTPTRELALQVEESVRTYGAHRRIRSVAIYGGVGFEPQVRALRAGPGVVVATPGRLLDHAGQGTIDLSRVEVLVLDEADRMLDMGFIRDIRRILALLPADRQNLLFSATFSNEIRSLADGLLRNPATVQVTPRNTATTLVTQLVHPVDRERKRELLSHLIRSGRIEQALVFARTKHGANRLAEQLARDGIAATAIHGNKSQGQRVRALDDFKAGRASILVATEVASRGLDIEQLPHVVNYELPMVAEDYVHRIGRTGRAGATGDAISLVCVDEAPLLREIEKLLGGPIPTEVIAGFEPDRSIRPEPIRQRSGDRHVQRRGAPVPRIGSRPSYVGGGAAAPAASAHRRPDRRHVQAFQGPSRQDRVFGRNGASEPRHNGADPRHNGADPRHGPGAAQPRHGGDRQWHRPGPQGGAQGNAPQRGPGHGFAGRTAPAGRSVAGTGFRTLPGERLARTGDRG